MRHFIYVVLVFFTSLFLQFGSANAADFMCTMEYSPVCAKVQVQCIRAPCYPVYQTFSNMCVMSQNSQAVFAHNGVCELTEEGSRAVLSTRLQNSLKRQYDVFFTRIALLDPSVKLSKLETIDARIASRLTTLSLSTIPMTLSQEMMADKIKYALLFLQNLVQSDISYTKDEISGMRYTSKDSAMCSNIRFYCSTTETPFFTDKGCGCKK